MRGSMFFLGSEVYFTSEKIDQQKLKKTQIQAKQNNMNTGRLLCMQSIQLL